VLEAALQRAMEKLPEGAVRSKWQARASSDLAQVMMMPLIAPRPISRR
jgi:hypothetical protein